MSEPSTFAEALDEAMRVSALGPAAVARQLAALGTPVSEGALRTWRSGERRPEHARSLDAVESLEGILGLPAGSLASRLGPSRRLRRSKQESQDDLVGMPGTLRPVLESIGCADLDELESLGGALVVDIGPDRRVRAIANRMLWRARTEGARRSHIVVGIEDGNREPPELRFAGASIGRSAFDPEHGWAVWEMILPRPLGVGETAMVEWGFAGEMEAEDTHHIEAVAERRVDDGSLWLRFDAEVPRHLEAYEDSDAGYAARVVRPTGGTVEHHVRDFGPGVFGFRWDW